MRVGINLLGLTPALSGGIELYAKKLVGEMVALGPIGAEVVLFCNRSNAAAFQAIVGNDPSWRVQTLDVRARPQALRVVAEQVALPALARRARLDVLHSPSYTWPIASGCRGVVTVCDMLYAIWPPGVPTLKRVFWRLAVPMSVRKCDRTITLSQHAKKDIVRILKCETRKVAVTYLAGIVSPPPGGVEEETIRSARQKHAPGFARYILSVGALGRHKNPETTLRAFALLRRRPCFRNFGLIMTGVDYGVGKQLRQLAGSLGVEGAVAMPGHVRSEELAGLYGGASVYLSTSLMEGFGMTAVEAMSFGVPVVVGNRGALPEVVGDGGIVVDALNRTEIADALAAVLDDETRARDLSAAARLRSRDFSWAQTAKTTWNVYESVLSGEPCCLARTGSRLAL